MIHELHRGENHVTPATEPSTTTRRLTLLVTTLASFLTPFMGASVTVALPVIGRDFGLGPLGLSWVATSYLLAAAILLVPFGKVGDTRGRTRVFILGMSIYTVASLLCTLAPSAAFLIASRVLQGVGGSMVFGTSVAILTAAFPPEQRGRVIGINVAAVYLGLSLGPFLGGLLTEHLGWRSVFAGNVLAGVVTTAVAIWNLPRDDRPPTARFDWAGTAFYSVGLGATISGFSRLPRLGGAALLILGGLAAAAFIRRERTTSNPVLDLDLIARNRVFAFSNLAALINYAATYAVAFLLSLYLQNVRGFGAQDAGLLLVVQPIVQAVVSPFAGRLSDRVPPRLVASAGMAVIVLGLVALALIGPATPLSWIGGGLATLGIGFGLFSSPNTSAVMGSVARAQYGVASATLATVRMTGQAFSMGIAMLVFALAGPQGGTVGLPALRISFAVFAGLCLLGTFASLARGKKE
ncbi:MAG TPA: MFS transporter [Vicinamibacterales bacterium]|nr:MFS transporter [Vicinamibacterales bacterium]